MKKKSFLILATMVLLLTFAVGGTIAYLVTSTTPVVNTFTPARVTCAVDEPGWTDGALKKQDVRIQNTGNTTAWIRAMVVANWYEGTDENKKIVAPATVSFTPESGWTQSGGYYYWNSTVAAGDYTGELIPVYEVTKAPVAGAHLEMTIVCQAVQSNLGTSATAAFAAAAQQPTT